MPLVFVSYSHDWPEHSARVPAFTHALRRHAIDMELDRFQLDQIADWPRWCNQQTGMHELDFGLCGATAEYRRRVEGGVRTE